VKLLEEKTYLKFHSNVEASWSFSI